MKFFKVFILFITSLSLTGCIHEGDNETDGANISVGDKLPVFSIELADGTKITNQDINGKVSVIMLFTTTCPDCQEQFPAVEEFYREYKEDERVIVFGISRADGKTSVGNYWSAHGLTFPYSPQENRNIYNLFAASIVPRIYIADPNQTVQYLFLNNPTATFADLKVAVKLLLRSV